MVAKGLPILALLVALALPGIGPAAAQQEKITGTAAGLDEDSIALQGGHRVRLWGIDAPEVMQTCVRGGRPWNCGREAARALDRLVTGKTVTCIVLVRDQLRRVIIGDCTLGGQSLSRWMVHNGWAVVNRRQTKGEAYITEEDEAREAKRGIWGSTFEMPWDYKIRQRLRGQPPPVGE
jgi:endonuclease YncB( thermonuclease family)